MIKKTLYFGNPAYLSLRNAQLVIKLPEVENNDSLPEAMKRQSASGSGKQRFASGSDETSVGSDQADRGFGGSGVGQQANHDYFRGYGSSVGE